MADSIPYLVPSQFQESIFPPITRPKIPTQGQIIKNSDEENPDEGVKVRAPSAFQCCHSVCRGVGGGGHCNSEGRRGGVGYGSRGIRKCTCMGWTC